MSNTQRHIVLAGGGTAGHVNPLLAVADAISDIDHEAVISVIGTAVGLEHDLVPQAGYELDAIAKVPFPRRPDLDALRFPRRWMEERRRVREILTRRQTQVVAGFGGYASAPVYAGAHHMGIPIVIHEQNARAGLANELGCRWAAFIGTAYENTGLKPRAGATMQRVGLPLRPAIAALCQRIAANPAAARADAARELGIDPARAVVVVTGGSLGAASLNHAVATSAGGLLGHAQIIHLTGRNKFEETCQLVAASAGEQTINDLDPAHAGLGDYHLAPYLERIDLAFACADLVICRSGAGSVSELAAIGLPAVYVPLPIGNGEQRFNAQPVVEAGGGLMVPDREFTAEWVKSHVPDLLSDHVRLRMMGEAAWGYGIRDAAEVMARQILALARRKPAQ
ncbi:UDP-N-acetylglucosamine--N-acetylmuramyl-(pentapeptide) pyrophosphoryl-undecaprenol N-acetylglucosamine transferase [Bifidobacterium sp.]|jgi:UDP-N-acetylglucosamine--N-acetylmuramyl-(pentapeptide) pyrophosphoryl-undecaprenol N-acetylglucosamine transferase|uniref:UDP-N-acetylglucosamine--N-acetylmuramyl- (pentapeptide) pyrophosphoryl-undecaprenol N-acetylglucosamine transferase n=1 Tax=Bifidobacterium sp. TaxID=41200 RepID=UPI0025BE677D|nr:UDP-N-acetylglucosamine--N-acetylmuramyl-(pentapeptide) pyrophosphoryl-undecaprenol N-acetylglucosamine transferase [Bifidobacterium sp.]MCH4209262.1 UDP-N-acetylglucosamine--N-acetylmuramyl-(pentapeptide) pyrophosphoryl-undecaprenol N-acetylglucosamine transferase [Bifidobacterium sp.]MCI1224056.1 UDP-N-acetylglucosamine--N-acetylmuramyl-(pentapeptide) pyrophosphoryl-undecaprenol N-acetylglucosamine transferase [Bifidobacterium sp.]